MDLKHRQKLRQFLTTGSIKRAAELAGHKSTVPCYNWLNGRSKTSKAAPYLIKLAKKEEERVSSVIESL